MSRRPPRVGPRSPADTGRPADNWRELEESRGRFREQAARWRSLAVQGLPRAIGLDLPEAEARMLAEAFERAHPGLEPDLAARHFAEFAGEYGYEVEASPEVEYEPGHGDTGPDAGQPR